MKKFLGRLFPVGKEAARKKGPGEPELLTFEQLGAAVLGAFVPQLLDSFLAGDASAAEHLHSLACEDRPAFCALMDKDGARVLAQVQGLLVHGATASGGDGAGAGGAEGSLSSVCYLASSLVGCSAALDDALLARGLVGSLAGALAGSRSNSVKRGALRGLAKLLVARPAQAAAQLAGCGGVGSVVALLDCEDPGLVRRSLVILRQACSLHGDDVARQAVACGALPALARLLGSSSPEAQQEAAELLLPLCRLEGAGLLLADVGGLSALSATADSGLSQAAQLACRQALARLAEAAARRSPGAGAGGGGGSAPPAPQQQAGQLTRRPAFERPPSSRLDGIPEARKQPPTQQQQQATVALEEVQAAVKSLRGGYARSQGQAAEWLCAALAGPGARRNGELVLAAGGAAALAECMQGHALAWEGLAAAEGLRSSYTADASDAVLQVALRALCLLCQADGSGIAAGTLGEPAPLAAISRLADRPGASAGTQAAAAELLAAVQGQGAAERAGFSSSFYGSSGLGSPADVLDAPTSGGFTPPGSIGSGSLHGSAVRGGRPFLGSGGAGRHSSGSTPRQHHSAFVFTAVDSASIHSTLQPRQLLWGTPVEGQGRRSSGAYGTSSALMATDMRSEGSGVSTDDGSWLISRADISICVDGQGAEVRLGEGGFGVVYKALMHGVDEVAIKVIKAPCPSDNELAIFHTEVRTLRSLHHRSIVQFYGACLEPGGLFLVTEFMKGGDLYSALRRHPGTLRWDRLGHKVALDVALGLNYLHARRPPMMHRDLKSPNVLLSEEGVAKICDVGMLRPQLSDLVTAQPVMTALWAAPEVVRRERASIKADIWSYGVLIWELVSEEDITECQPLAITAMHAGSGRGCGAAPAGPPAAGSLHARASMDSSGGARLVELPPGCPPVAAHIFRECTRADPGQRPTAGQIVGWLRGDAAG